MLQHNTINYPSHLITVPAGVNPADAVMNSPLMMGEFAGIGMDIGAAEAAGGGSGGGGMGGGQFAEYGGINPDLDPEMAMAIRASIEEERAAAAARVCVIIEWHPTDIFVGFLFIKNMHMSTFLFTLVLY